MFLSATNGNDAAFQNQQKTLFDHMKIKLLGMGMQQAVAEITKLAPFD